MYSNTMSNQHNNGYCPSTVQGYSNCGCGRPTYNNSYSNGMNNNGMNGQYNNMNSNNSYSNNMNGQYNGQYSGMNGQYNGMNGQYNDNGMLGNVQSAFSELVNNPDPKQNFFENLPDVYRQLTGQPVYR